jgi:hypothetical protein
VVVVPRDGRLLQYLQLLRRQQPGLLIRLIDRRRQSVLPRLNGLCSPASARRAGATQTHQAQPLLVVARRGWHVVAVPLRARGGTSGCGSRAGAKRKRQTGCMSRDWGNEH